LRYARSGSNSHERDAERIRRLIVKEFIQLMRNPRARFALIVPPVIQMLIFGYAASYTVRHVATAILDRIVVRKATTWPRASGRAPTSTSARRRVTHARSKTGSISAKS
jgi:ABC-2 type transport system permease protein